MAVLAALCLALLAGQTTVFTVALLWFLFSAFQNGEYATLSAAIPDHVPVRQRATVAGWVGMPIALGLVVEPSWSWTSSTRTWSAATLRSRY